MRELIPSNLAAVPARRLESVSVERAAAYEGQIPLSPMWSLFKPYVYGASRSRATTPAASSALSARA